MRSYTVQQYVDFFSFLFSFFLFICLFFLLPFQIAIRYEKAVQWLTNHRAKLAILARREAEQKAMEKLNKRRVGTTDRDIKSAVAEAKVNMYVKTHSHTHTLGLEKITGVEQAEGVVSTAGGGGPSSAAAAANAANPQAAIMLAAVASMQGKMGPSGGDNLKQQHSIDSSSAADTSTYSGEESGTVKPQESSELFLPNDMRVPMIKAPKEVSTVQ